MILEYFSDVDRVAVVITDPSAGTMVDGVFTPGTTSIFSGLGWCWKNRGAANFNGESIAVDSGYSVVLRPDEATTPILDKYRLTVAGIEYKIDSVDDIAFQGEAILITCYRTGQNG